MAQSNKSRRKRSSKKQRAEGPRPVRPAVSDDAPATTRRAVPGAGVPSLKASREEAPQPIWAPFPLTELLILLGLVMAVVGLISRNMPVAIGGLVIVSSASIELASREHFAGYRSHSALLAGLGAVISVTVLAFGGSAIDVTVPPWAIAVVGVLVFVSLFVLLRRAFRRRTGGLSFRV